MLARQSKQNPHMALNDTQKGLADTRVMVLCVTVLCCGCTHMICIKKSSEGDLDNFDCARDC